MQQEQKPPWVKSRIIAAPKIRQIYWCEYWQDARLPEMWKTRPVIVVSYRNTLHGPCTVIPTSSAPQNDNPWAYRLSLEIEGDGIKSWAICNHPTTISPSRLAQFNKGMPILPQTDFDQVIERLMKWLPKRL